MKYNNKINNLRLYCITYIILLIFAMILGYSITNKVYHIEEVKLYNIEGDRLTSDISFVATKTLNQANNKFNSSIKDVDINIYPISAQDHFYRMNIKSKSNLSEVNIKI